MALVGESLNDDFGFAVRKPRVLGQRGEMGVEDPRQICRTQPRCFAVSRA